MIVAGKKEMSDSARAAARHAFPVSRVHYGAPMAFVRWPTSCQRRAKTSGKTKTAHTHRGGPPPLDRLTLPDVAVICRRHARAATANAVRVEVCHPVDRDVC